MTHKENTEGRHSPARIPNQWDMEADIVIVGCGVAGTGAALAAIESGSSVLVLDKAGEQHAGGDTRSSGGGIFRSLEDPTELVENSFGQMSLERATNIIREGKRLTQLLLDNGAEFLGDDYVPEMAAPEETEIFESGNAPVNMVVGGGTGVYRALKNANDKAGVPIQYETPAKKLIVDPQTAEVIGVVAEQQGKRVSIKANKAVILASGGYAGNADLVNQFHLAGVEHGTQGSPYSTGDGLIMGQEAGVALSGLNMGLELGEVLFKVASKEAGTGLPTLQAVAHDSRIFVNRAGERFMDEQMSLHHIRGLVPFLDFDTNPFVTWRDRTFPNLPMFMITDQACLDSGPLGLRDIPYGWSAASGIHNWSADNKTEIEKGWIVKADTLEELAGQLSYQDADGSQVSVSAEALKQTVETYNAQCAAGEGDHFGRLAEGMKPISNGPFYGAEMMTGIIYTIGGLTCNEHGQAVNYHSQPIPRLYIAGDISHGVRAQPLGLAGCFGCGRLAGEHAATLAPPIR